MNIKNAVTLLGDALGAAYYRATWGRRKPSKLVAVVVPLSDRPTFTAEEELSLRHLERHLGRHDRYLIAPEGMPVDRPGFAVERHPRRFFGSIARHRKLVISPRFYRPFRDYRFILIYHLDALVFSDQLVEWCERDYDYIGAPWVKHPDAPYAGNTALEDKVGNGGFSLRKVESFMKLLVSRRPALPDLEQISNTPKRLLLRSSLFNNVRWELAQLPYASEEQFLANRAAYYHPGFKIAPLATALEFAFECVPRHCYELNGRRMPFGCHGWARYDPAFWEPHLLHEPERGQVRTA